MKVNHNCFISVIFFLFFCTIASLHADIVNPDVVQVSKVGSHLPNLRNDTIGLQAFKASSVVIDYLLTDMG